MKKLIKMSLFASILLGAFMVNHFHITLLCLTITVCTFGILFRYLNNQFEIPHYVFYPLYLPIIHKLHEVKENQSMMMSSVDYHEGKTINPLLFKGSRRKNTDKPTIVLVESNEELSFHIKSHLSEDYSILSFKNGAEALSHIQENHPHIVISNITLDGINGNYLSARLKNNKETLFIPVLLYGLPTINEFHYKRKASLADTFLALPFDKEDLKSEISVLLENRFLFRRHLLQRIFGEQFMEIESNNSLTDEEWNFINQVKDFILANIQDENLTITDIASILCMSRSSFFNKWKSLTGEAPNTFLTILRMEKARQLLESGKYAVADIPLMIGLKDDKHFRKSYKKYFKMTPSTSIRKKS